jgi:hypothetical protein
MEGGTPMTLCAALRSQAEAAARVIARRQLSRARSHRTSASGWEAPYYGDNRDALVRYMALQTRRVAWMREFLRTGEDRPVRYIRPAAPDDTPQPAVTRPGLFLRGVGGVWSRFTQMPGGTHG